MLPVRSGTSQNGNEWKRLPFVFAYYETPDQRWEDRVLLEAYDTNAMAQISQYCEIGADGKVVVENGNVKLKVLDIKCKCGFSHNTRDITTKSGEQLTINDMKCYKLEIAGQQQQAQQPASQMPFPPHVNATNPNDDGLPF